ncbi:uncharacterized protein E6C27_scaffold270G00390 [Cucumis melo var. makuwa]|uniref:DUF4218 domain-containing protein n=1 Tax=Cucumis melo var. makuwa TaxID=1194695 RepID=A0A5A7T5C7_CUCMM|nr:uncharacterized protein E6C27_scaffold270G00390 [Cucumis melo var. makuwa]
MSLLIPNPRSPGRKIDLYLQPLIEELKKLWTFGVRTYYFLTDQFFQLYAALLWTINDFPTYGDLSWWSKKGYQACPICMGDRSSFRIQGRISFMRHRLYLPENPKGRVSDLDRLQADIIIIRCKLERIFPPVFFSVMVHLAVHLPYEIKVTGSVSYSWMYPIERSRRTLKQYVRNKARLKRSIAEVYVMNESSTFCLHYLSGIETRCIRDERNDDTILEDELIGEFEIFKQKVQPLDASSLRTISQEEKRLFHWHYIVISIRFPRDGGSSLVGDNSSESNNGTSQPSATLTSRRHAQSRLLKLERQAISVCVRKTFLIRCLKWADVGREYFEIVKGDLQHFKKYSDPEEADANPPYLLVGSDDDCHYLCDHYMSRAFKFLNLLQHQMLELQSQPTSEGNQPLFRDEIWETVLDRRSGYSKRHGWGPKPKAYKMTIASSSTMSCLQSRVYSRALITC